MIKTPPERVRKLISNPIRAKLAYIGCGRITQLPGSAALKEGCKVVAAGWEGRVFADTCDFVTGTRYGSSTELVADDTFDKISEWVNVVEPGTPEFGHGIVRDCTEQGVGNTLMSMKRAVITYS